MGKVWRVETTKLKKGEFMKIETMANNLLKKILQMNFTKSRVVHYKTEIRKVGLYEDIDERVEYLNSLEKKADREYKRNLEKLEKI